MAEFSYSGSTKTKITPKAVRRRRLLLVVPVIFLFIVFLYIVGYKASIRTRELRAYIEQTNSATIKSNKVSLKLKNQLKNPSARVKSSLGTDLYEMTKTCTYLSDYAERMVVPERFQQIQSYYIMTMKLRNKGMSLYDQAISGKASAKAKDKKIKEALRYFDFSDLAYQTFKEELNNVIKGEKLNDKSVESKFITNNNFSSNPNLKLANDESKANEKPADVSVDDVATDPLRISINTDTQVRVLPLTDSIDVRVKVKNTGKVDLTNVPVVVELVTGNKTSGEKKQGTIDSIDVDGTAKITLQGFSPTAGSMNKFKITVGPVAGEQSKSDNSYVYKFILRDVSQDQTDNNQTQDGASQTSTN